MTSPNFPCGYLNDLDIVQKIQVPEGNTIWIRFTDFECERKHDTVTLTDGDGTRLGLFDGEANSDDDWRHNEIVSNTEVVEVLFHTDSSGYMAGWKLDWGMYWMICVACIILNVTGTVGDQEAKPKSWILTSPYWPQPYSNNIRSTQTIQVPEGNTIRFAWTNLDTGSSDYVQIKDGDGTDLTPKLSQYYEIGESKLPPPGVSNSNIMHVKFHTDGDSGRTGWRLEWGKCKVIFLPVSMLC